MSLQDIAVESLSTAFPYVALGSNASTQVGTRVSADWDTSSDGTISASDLSFTGLTANQSVTHVLLFAASTGGSVGGAIELGGGSDTSANAAGEYTIDSISVTVS